jgi:hypothetical protein
MKLQPFYPNSAVVAFSIAGLTRHRRPQTNLKMPWFCQVLGGMEIWVFCAQFISVL